MENIPGDKKNSKFKRVLVFSLVIALLLVFLSMILAPGIAKKYINKNGKELTGRTISIDKLKYNYFTSTVKIIGFRYFEQNDSDVFVAFDTLLVNMKPLKLFSDEIYIQQIRLVNPNCQIIQNDSIFNFNDLLDFHTREKPIDSEIKKNEDKTFYKLNLHDLVMKNGSFHYSDLALNHSFNFNKFTFVIPQIYWGEPDKSKANITFELANGGRFETSLNYNVQEETFEGYARIEHLYLNTFLPYIQQYLQVPEADGFISSEINFSGSGSNYEETEIDGTLIIDSLKLYDYNNDLVLSGTQSKAILNVSKPLKHHIDVDLVQFDQPYVYFALIDSLSNFDKMLVEAEEEEEPTELKTDKNVAQDKFTINRFVINNGIIDFNDQRFREVFNYELSEVTVDMDTFELQDDWVNINANMILNKRGNLTAELGLRPFNPLDSIQVNYVLTDFQLPDINVYSKHYMGLPILFGDMYYVSNTSIVNKQLTSENELIIRNVEMGRKSGGLYDVPVKLALFILKDINGDINLDIPVRGDLSDPKTKLGPIIWNTFKNLMVKIVASPFKALGNLLGADPKELEEITFDYGDTTLTARQIRSLNLLLELEQKKPELQIQLQYYNDKKLERTDAAEEISTQLYLEEMGKKAGSNSKDYLKFLKGKTGKDSLLLQDYEILFAPAEMVDSVLEAREQTRLTLSRSYLNQKNDSTTIRIFYNSTDVLNIGSRPRFEVKFVLAEDAKEQ